MYRASDPTFHIDYVRSRLEGTALYYPKEKSLVYVHRVFYNKEKDVLVDASFNWDRNNPIEVRISLDELELKTPPLGSVDYEGESFFSCRYPLRNDWKQGLRSNNVRFVGRKSLITPPVSYLIQAIENKYVRLGEALDKVEEYFSSVALSRHFSVEDDFSLVYKNKIKVGKINEDNGTLKLNQDNAWLFELAQEETGIALDHHN